MRPILNQHGAPPQIQRIVCLWYVRTYADPHFFVSKMYSMYTFAMLKYSVAGGRSMNPLLRQLMFRSTSSALHHSVKYSPINAVDTARWEVIGWDSYPTEKWAECLFFWSSPCFRPAELLE